MKRILTRTSCILAILVSLCAGALAGDPGIPIPFASTAHQVSDQTRGFMLIYNIYTSSATNPSQQNTRINLTNTSDQFAVSVHLFFVDGATCSISDRYVCLTPNQTTTFLASEQDPGTTGYLVAVATGSDGEPAPFDFLMGDAFVKFENGFFGNLGAEAVPAGLVPFISVSNDGTLFALLVTGMPRVLAVDNIGSRGDGNETLLVVNGVGGVFTIAPTTVGSLFGILYDDQESAHSWTSAGGCQLVTQLSNNFPRTAPRFDVVIPAGQTGWMKFWSTSTVNNSPISTSADARALLGAVFQRNPNSGLSSGAFQGARNLHKLRVTSAPFEFNGQEMGAAPQSFTNLMRGRHSISEISLSNITIFVFPIFPPNCGFVDSDRVG
ncbi:MAG: hypothetical protein KF868_09370 [Acidobacteria bacterium]|nr:hypothetical protein [Acidobacteriota bacterium]